MSDIEIRASSIMLHELAEKLQRPAISKYLILKESMTKSREELHYSLSLPAFLILTILLH